MPWTLAMPVGFRYQRGHAQLPVCHTPGRGGVTERGEGSAREGRGQRERGGVSERGAGSAREGRGHRERGGVSERGEGSPREGRGHRDSATAWPKLS